MKESTKYRPCVGISVINKEGKILIAMRKDIPGAWQMPQGGIESGEEAEDAAFRELEEETGISRDKVSLISSTSDWLMYDYPSNLPLKHTRNYKGQQQKWFLMSFLGKDEDINILTKEPEFSEWRWALPSEVISLIIPFKKQVYTQVFSFFNLL